MTRVYTHEIGSEIRSISGGYILDEEAVIEIEGRRVLYVVGNALADTTCCGVYGCRFALVPGYVVRWRHSTDEAGNALSEVEPIVGDAIRNRISKEIGSVQDVSQVNFW